MEPPTALLPSEERIGVADCLFRFDRREAGEDIAAEFCSCVLWKVLSLSIRVEGGACSRVETAFVESGFATKLTNPRPETSCSGERALTAISSRLSNLDTLTDNRASHPRYI